MPPWNQMHYNCDPTVNGLNEALALIPPPKFLANINGIQEWWKVAVLAMLVHQLHNGSNHINLTHGFHSLTSTHYHTGLLRLDSGQQVNQDQRLNLWQTRTDHTRTILSLIFDLCTTLDRHMGGSTLFFHYPGATTLGGIISPESLKADVYINPRVLAEDRELHQTIAAISQLFIERLVTPLHKPSHTPATQYNRLPLVPTPITKSSCHFDIRGRPSGSLAQLMGLNTPLLSAVPQGSPLTWNMQVVPVSSAPVDPNTLNILVRKQPLVVVCDSDSEDDGYPDSGPITPIRIKGAIPSAVKVSKYRAPQSSSPKDSQPSSSFQQQMSPLRVHHKVLMSFSPEMEEIIDCTWTP
ncbi:hypothetical protein DFH29DRAFT_1007036 [Suillus ampliporus]|nr:hypothetical protein DFH29DRAFT_1007036 [Suillus ampliporus]